MHHLYTVVRPLRRLVNMPGHALFYIRVYSRFVVDMRVWIFASCSYRHLIGSLFDKLRMSQTAVRSSSLKLVEIGNILDVYMFCWIKTESKHRLYTKFISCKVFIYILSLNTLILHKCKIHAFTFPQVCPSPMQDPYVFTCSKYDWEYNSPAYHLTKS